MTNLGMYDPTRVRALVEKLEARIRELETQQAKGFNEGYDAAQRQFVPPLLVEVSQYEQAWACEKGLREMLDGRNASLRADLERVSKELGLYKTAYQIGPSEFHDRLVAAEVARDSALASLAKAKEEVEELIAAATPHSEWERGVSYEETERLRLALAAISPTSPVEKKP